MKANALSVSLLCFFSVAIFSGCKNMGHHALPADATKTDFEKMNIGETPKGFTFGRTGEGHNGDWKIEHVDGRRALIQTDLDSTDFRYTIAALEQPRLADVEVITKYKTVAGEIDQAGGVVCRYTGPDRYYIARANALEQNVRLYHVVGGKRTQIGNWTGTVKGNVWHELSLRAKGDQLVVTFDGKILIEVKDSAIPEAGMAGVWTKADSKTYFDEIVIEPAK